MKGSFKVHGLLWREISSLSGYIVPPLPRFDAEQASSLSAVLSSLNKGRNDTILSNSSDFEYKGSMGRITIVGGSAEYTGAPYYAAQSALKFGADLCSVYCSSSAAIPLKSYSPELMVSILYDDSLNVDLPLKESVRDSLTRQHAVVVGPGLGRGVRAGAAAMDIIRWTRELNKLLVIDADGLWLLNQDPSAIIGYKRCILTPNRMEFLRLVDATVRRLESQQDSESEVVALTLRELRSDSEHRQVRALSSALGGVCILRKGAQDLLSAGDDVFVILGEAGSPRRCGGQGDILAGSLAVALYWAVEKRAYTLPPLSAFLNEQTQSVAVESELPSISGSSCSSSSSNSGGSGSGSGSGGRADSSVSPSSYTSESEKVLMAGVLASIVVKRASGLAFSAHGRSVTAPDIVDKIGHAFDNICL